MSIKWRVVKVIHYVICNSEKLEMEFTDKWWLPGYTVKWTKASYIIVYIVYYFLCMKM